MHYFATVGLIHSSALGQKDGRQKNDGSINARGNRTRGSGLGAGIPTKDGPRRDRQTVRWDGDEVPGRNQTISPPALLGNWKVLDAVGGGGGARTEESWWREQISHTTTTTNRHHSDEGGRRETRMTAPCIHVAQRNMCDATRFSHFVPNNYKVTIQIRAPYLYDYLCTYLYTCTDYRLLVVNTKHMFTSAR